ncbi:hypothetical protein ABB37_01472 [Leptomonas pyrrhocoris]|uniref:Uncharacterized protein n=1 Tax=Leptomonas pyrrhocoris TaxID=157538 RepID=A0A0N0VH45_LEPPY|nr:hypothetical protein ABB37_01472 [Leptomonas pyrrhocoris]KPA85054.1 hypothetical protein ABB37_01472 [Leptomonas pyrrhocoris]|eukprot:XP_015663493.1 hypothetical protein ABB37_01472 [Leptomonas pyrrhocoris]
MRSPLCSCRLQYLSMSRKRGTCCRLTRQNQRLPLPLLLLLPLQRLRIMYGVVLAATR